jgi:uncharacterized membrane protein
MYAPPPGGYQQPLAAQMSADPGVDSSTGLKANIAGLVCYLGMWVTGILFLLIEKKNQVVKFQAAQSLVVFGALGILGFILNFVPYVGFLSLIIWIAEFFLWLFLMYKAYQGEAYKLPIAGDIAQGIAGKM